MRRWSRLPLRTQLTVVFAGLLVVGLGLSGVAALTLLRQSLVTQLDKQLYTAAEEYIERNPSRETGIGGEHDLSEYQAVVFSTSGEVLDERAASVGTDAAPDIPALTAAEVLELDSQGFTVSSTDGEVTWRVLARPLVTQDSQVVGSVAVALPMTSAHATLERMRTVLLVIGATVVGLGAFAGSWGVRHSLRPLRQIEDTAAAIADGDLSRRVPDAEPSTEVGRLAVALNGMLTQIEQAFAVRTASEQRMRRFVADASHELRTPLATIRGYGELYRMGALTGPDDVPRTMARMEDSAKRMGTLVEDLLHLARLEEGRTLRHEPVDLAVLAGDAVADLRALDPTRPVRIEPLPGRASIAGAVALGDEDRLRQVVNNLVGNVVQHTPAGTAVELAVGPVAGTPRADGVAQVRIEVRDHGPGIPPEHAARVFERFYRIDAARGRDSGGAGLGMAIVAAIVDAHGGSVEVDRTAGGGTTVRVTLPGATPAPGPGPGGPGGPGAAASTQP
ncbi:sensor histidine kinase [Actinotalea subterranea]|uniref:sensor histidine kinase n=1 Tax=Actinotalea subterranea TaxID=2607497 RepID=UPI0011EDCEA9|nr:ATP-binding protein [Actinotalea subterranea]